MISLSNNLAIFIFWTENYLKQSGIKSTLLYVVHLEKWWKISLGCFIHFMVKYFKFEYKNTTHHLELYEVIMWCHIFFRSFYKEIKHFDSIESHCVPLVYHIFLPPDSNQNHEFSVDHIHAFFKLLLPRIHFSNVLNYVIQYSSHYWTCGIWLI